MPTTSHATPCPVSTYKVTAWRDKSGTHGITVHTRTPVGWDNVTADVTLIGDAEIERFLGRCWEAAQRSRAFTEPTHEPSPGAYDNWPGED